MKQLHSNYNEFYESIKRLRFGFALMSVPIILNIAWEAYSYLRSFHSSS